MLINIDSKHFFKSEWKNLSLLRKFTFNYLPIKLFLLDFNIPKDAVSDIIFFQSMHRNDYNEFNEKIFNSIESNNKLFVKIKMVKRINLNFLHIVGLNYWHLWMELVEIKNFSERIFVYLSFLNNLAIINKLANMNPKCIITHADMQPIENIIIQYFNHKNIKTVTLQHGLYIDYSSFSNVNEVNYKHVVSQYFLAWGEETKELIHRYHPQCKILVCGNPTLNKINYHAENFFSVVFDQEIFKEYNQQLIKIAQEMAINLNMKILLRMHPRNNIEDYDLKNDLFIKNKDIHNSKFVLGHTTTMIFQLMRNGVPVFKYNTNIPANQINKAIVFDSTSNLLNKINSVDTFNFKEEGKFYIKYIDEDSINQYKKIIKDITYE